MDGKQKQSTGAIYTYCFNVWPDESWKPDFALFDLFRMLDHSVMKDMTEAEFNRFRSGLSHHGLTLREIGRVPYVEAEIIL